MLNELARNIDSFLLNNFIYRSETRNMQKRIIINNARKLFGDNYFLTLFLMSPWPLPSGPSMDNISKIILYINIIKHRHYTFL